MRGNGRLSWKRRCKGFWAQEVAFESLLKGKRGIERTCQAQRRTGMKAGGHKGTGPFGKFKLLQLAWKDIYKETTREMAKVLRIQDHVSQAEE